jgi:hypothetical protein
MAASCDRECGYIFAKDINSHFDMSRHCNVKLFEIDEYNENYNRVLVNII